MNTQGQSMPFVDTWEMRPDNQAEEWSLPYHQTGDMDPSIHTEAWMDSNTHNAESRSPSLSYKSQSSRTLKTISEAGTVSSLSMPGTFEYPLDSSLVKRMPHDNRTHIVDQDRMSSTLSFQDDALLTEDVFENMPGQPLSNLPGPTSSGRRTRRFIPLKTEAMYDANAVAEISCPTSVHMERQYTSTTGHSSTDGYTSGSFGSVFTSNEMIESMASVVDPIAEDFKNFVNMPDENVKLDDNVLYIDQQSRPIGIATNHAMFVDSAKDYTKPQIVVSTRTQENFTQVRSMHTSRPTMRGALDMDDNRYRTDEKYNATPGADGLYHCPFKTEQNCNHAPNKLKCNYDKFIDSHLKPFRCKAESCANQAFSSTACLLRHEREAHGLHGHGKCPHLCHYMGCERSHEGRGFPRLYNLRDHMKRVHDWKESDDTGMAHNETRKTSGRKRKMSAHSKASSSSQKARTASWSCQSDCSGQSITAPVRNIGVSSVFHDGLVSTQSYEVNQDWNSHPFVGQATDTYLDYTGPFFNT